MKVRLLSSNVLVPMFREAFTQKDATDESEDRKLKKAEKAKFETNDGKSFCVCFFKTIICYMAIKFHPSSSSPQAAFCHPELCQLMML